MTDEQLPPPDLTAHGYQYLRPIEGGRGGYAQVYVYEQQMPRREVAVKVLKTRGGEAEVRAILDEANAMARLENHPHVVVVLGTLVSADGRPCIVMMYCRGRNLHQLVADGMLDVRRVVRLGIQIADVVQAAHAERIIHRDIKPANILTDERGSPRLTDFGIAGRVMPGVDTEDREFGVSLPWCPPELLDGESGSVASDIFSLGATLWHLLAGRSPVDVSGHNTRAEIEQRIRHVPPPRTGRGDVPPALEALLARMLEKDPRRRPGSANQVVAELTQIERQLGGAAGTSWYVTGAPPPPAPPPVAPELADTAERARRSGRRPAPVAPPLSGQVAGSSPSYGAASAVSAHTELRDRQPEAPAPAPLPEPAPGRGSRSVWVAAVLVLALAGAALLVLRPWAESPQSPSSVDSSTGSTGQDPGGLGDNLPPGVPTVTASRVDDLTMRFTWEYSNPRESDEYRWRSDDGREDVVEEPVLDLAVPAGTTVCVQVRVVRSDGSHATVDWSPEGCGGATP